MKNKGFDETQAGKRVDNIPDTGTLTGNWETDFYGCWWEYRLDSSIDVDSFAWIIGEYPKEED